MWCKSLTLEKYISFRMKWFFSPPFLSVSPFLLLNLVRRRCYAYAIGLYTRPEIKSWPDVQFCAHAHCVLPRCWSTLLDPKSSGKEARKGWEAREGGFQHRLRYTQSPRQSPFGWSKFKLSALVFFLAASPLARTFSSGSLRSPKQESLLACSPPLRFIHVIGRNVS